MTGLHRGPWAVALILANLLNAYVTYGALMAQPQGAWDEHTLTGIEFASALLITLGVSTSLFALVPVRREALSRWWLAPSLIFLAVGAARLGYIVHTYPQGPGG
ncbi:hypothetical protein ACFWFI_23950 [Streptomyces sp. NPDC060209]|uniref:hypothetical protein n=1 Tax=Streptomyces sp. NPDC060209 TaxID=3347073 RepID=UPI003649238C